MSLRSYYGSIKQSDYCGCDNNILGLCQEKGCKKSFNKFKSRASNVRRRREDKKECSETD